MATRKILALDGDELHDGRGGASKYFRSLIAERRP
jgi:hypothetical protein